MLIVTGLRSAVSNMSGNRCERRVVVSNKQKYVHEVLVNCLCKLAQEKVWLGELTARHDHSC